MSVFGLHRDIRLRILDFRFAIADFWLLPATWYFYFARDPAFPHGLCSFTKFGINRSGAGIVGFEFIILFL
jgi:hypothetical protein